MIANCLDRDSNSEYVLHEVINTYGYRIKLMAKDPQDAIAMARETPLTKWEEPYK
jgi:hypothetical protein